MSHLGNLPIPIGDGNKKCPKSNRCWKQILGNLPIPIGDGNVNIVSQWTAFGSAWATSQSPSGTETLEGFTLVV